MTVRTGIDSMGRSVEKEQPGQPSEPMDLHRTATGGIPSFTGLRVTCPNHLPFKKLRNRRLTVLSPGRAPRILASRTIFVADDRNEALKLAETGLERQR